MDNLQRSDIVKILTLIRINDEKAYQLRSSKEAETLVDFWYESLSIYPQEVVFAATKLAIQNSEFTVKLATIINEIKKIKTSLQKSDVELWNELNEVLFIVNYESAYLNYDRERDETLKKLNRIYQSLSAEIRLYVTSLNELINISRMDKKELSYEKDRFLKAMPKLKENAEYRAKSERFMQFLESKEVYQIEDKKVKK